MSEGVSVEIWALNYARELAERGSPVTVNVVDPGKVRSDLERYLKWNNTNWSVHFWRLTRKVSQSPSVCRSQRKWKS